VKLAREEPKPAPGRPPPPRNESAALALRREAPRRKTFAPSFPDAGSPIKPRPAERPAFLDLNFSIHSSTLARLGIFALVLAILVFIRYRVSSPPPGPPSAVPVRAPAPPTVLTPGPKISDETEMQPAPGQLDCLAGDGPTYILAVRQLESFQLPIHSISRFQNLLQRFNRLEVLPADIRLEAATDRWDFRPGALMQVKGRENAKLSASTPELECDFDYAAWLDAKDAPVGVQMQFPSAPSAFSIHFGFASTNGGDPFRLLIVKENNPPAPLLLGRQCVSIDRPDVNDSLAAPLRERLFANFKLLGGRQWQLQPLLQTGDGAARWLYKDWPARDAPPEGQELNLTAMARRLREQCQESGAQLAKVTRPLKRPLGPSLQINRGHLESFADYAGADLAPGRFLEYLDELKKAAPTNSWIKKWGGHIDPGDPEEAALKMQRLYELWVHKLPEDQAMLTMTNAAGAATNYFYAAWQLLKETAPALAKLNKLRGRLNEVTGVSHIGLFIADPSQPKPGLEMIRFPAPQPSP
jgi:hypothetical protein